MCSSKVKDKVYINCFFYTFYMETYLFKKFKEQHLNEKDQHIQQLHYTSRKGGIKLTSYKSLASNLNFQSCQEKLYESDSHKTL